MNFQIATNEFLTIRKKLRSLEDCHEMGMITKFELENRIVNMILGGEKKLLSLIVAYDENRVIGNEGKVPWNLPEDRKHFKEMTLHCPVVMGRKTWESLPEEFRPLPKRTNFVVSRTQKKSSHENTFFVTSLEGALDLARHTDPDKTVWVIGGEEIYRAALDGDWVDRVVTTEVKGSHFGDAFFPKLPEEKWERIPVSSHEKYDIIWYLRRTT